MNSLIDTISAIDLAVGFGSQVPNRTINIRLESMARMVESDPDWMDWIISITYEVEERVSKQVAPLLDRAAHR